MFCGSDVLAVGALNACIDAGLQCPRDISIVGFENLEIGEYVEPALTTVEVSGAEMGVKAAEIIVSILGKSERPQNVRLDAPLIVRRSTSKAPD